ncbi:MAG: hypothetical protein QG596_2002 [Actinomycetota bacterium]|jgi:hypothetical protein|nr:hypothetical protein [Actinomycetota bacterium]
MGLFSRSGQSGRERRAMQDHIRELDEMRRTNLGNLGQMTVEMASEGRFDRRRLSEQAAEVVKIDREADLIARGLEEGLTLEELEDLARSGDGTGSR